MDIFDSTESLITPLLLQSLRWNCNLRVKRRAGQSGEPTVLQPGAPMYNGLYMKYGAGTVRFPHAKDFRRKLFAIWARAVKKFHQVCPR